MDATSLAEIRKLRGLTQTSLAAKAEVSRATIANLERGTHHNPSTKTLQRIASALDVDLGVLLGGSPQGGARRRRSASARKVRASRGGR